MRGLSRVVHLVRCYRSLHSRAEAQGLIHGLQLPHHSGDIAQLDATDQALPLGDLPDTRLSVPLGASSHLSLTGLR